MALYLIGDLQSCCTPFKQLLEKIDFSPSRDELVLLGDMVNRGPETIETLDTILQYGGAIQCLLGNHDIHFLGVAYGLRTERPRDTLTPILESSKKDAYVEWFREQHMALYKEGWLMVHAGVFPEWTLNDTLAYAKEVESVIRGDNIEQFLQEIFGNTPDQWSKNLHGIDRLRAIVNALTRTRFCYPDGRLDMDYKLGIEGAPNGLIPWFDMPNRKTIDVPIAFGHWSALHQIQPANNLLALDTGCLWGGSLTAAEVKGGALIELFQIKCEQSVNPIKGSCKNTKS